MKDPEKEGLAEALWKQDLAGASWQNLKERHLSEPQTQELAERCCPCDTLKLKNLTGVIVIIPDPLRLKDFNGLLFGPLKLENRTWQINLPSGFCSRLSCV